MSESLGPWEIGDKSDEESDVTEFCEQSLPPLAQKKKSFSSKKV